MSYQLIFTKKAKKDTKKLDSIAKKKIGKKILLLKKSPYKLSKKLLNSKLGDYRYRIGNYRVILDIKDKTVTILRISHRKEIYR
jgi:mRNA interferase RelE/StbE